MEITTFLMLFIAVGFASVCASIWFMFRFFMQKIETRIDDFMRVETGREEELRERERLVVAAAFEGELLANRTKIEAFILIYQEMLRNLKDPGRGPKYQHGEQIIHERPTLARTIFDAYVNRLELLGFDLAGDLSKIYAQVETDPVYKTLDSHLNADQMRHVIERIIESAKALISPIETTIAALRIIVRTKQKF